MTSHYARLHDTAVRRHWEAARKIDITGSAVTLDPDGPVADAAWAKQRIGRATQALPNGFCGLPVQKTCPHANACLTCPMFITTGEFLPQHRAQRDEVHQIINAAQARGHSRLVEMNQQVADNLETIITALESDADADPDQSQETDDAADNTDRLAQSARQRHELTRSKAIRALREIDRVGTAVNFEVVARNADVSRSWLYTQPDIRAEIERLREATRNAPAPSIPAAQRTSDASMLTRLQAANENNRLLTQENQRLRRQLAHALGDQRADRARPSSRAEPVEQHRASLTIEPG